MTLVIEITDFSKHDAAEPMMTSRLIADERVHDGHDQASQLTRLVDLNKKIKETITDAYGFPPEDFSKPDFLDLLRDVAEMQG